MQYNTDILNQGPGMINPVNADTENAERGSLRFRRASSL